MLTYVLKGLTASGHMAQSGQSRVGADVELSARGGTLSTMDSSPPDLTPLQALLRKGKATSAQSQAMLDDPAGAALMRKAEDALESAIRDGQVEKANRAADILRNLLDKEGALREAMAVTADRERNVRVVIETELDRRGGDGGKPE